MLVAYLFAIVVVSAGFAMLRTLGLAKGAQALGLAPAAGLGVLTVLATWAVLLRLPPPLSGLLLLGVSATGVLVVVRDRAAVCEALVTVARKQRLATATFAVALAVPTLVLGVAFAAVQVPLSPHDGAAHTEAIDAARHGQALLTWYPPGLSSLFAAWLALFPWIDSAKGAFDTGMALPILAAVAVFGLGVAVWHDLRAAAAGALLLGFTYDYPYFPQLWSGWPLATSLVLVMGVWSVALEYCEAPRTRWAALGGVLLGAIVLVHGTELYTLAIVLLVVVAANWRRLPWSGLFRNVALATAIAVVCALIYLPVLFNWAGAGGAYSVGLEDGAVPQTASASIDAGPEPFVVFALGSLGIDSPIRVALLLAGSVWALRRGTGRTAVVVGVLFALIAAMFSAFGSGGVMRQVYAAVFPWGMHYRVFMVVAIAQVVPAGMGAVVVLESVERLRFARAWARRFARRFTRLLAATWLALMTWAMVIFMQYPTGLVLGYGRDDDVAMAWLREHAGPGDVVINDGFADGGIWAPYKAGLAVLLPRTGLASPVEAQARMLVIDNVARLEEVPEAAATACQLGAKWVYYGARTSEWDARRFPPMAELEASATLEEVFRQGDATLFRTRLACHQAR